MVNWVPTSLPTESNKKSVAVVNLNTSETVGYYTCAPEQAVIAAYAQIVKKDFCTWLYDSRYASLVRRGKRTVSCGDFCALL